MRTNSQSILENTEKEVPSDCRPISFEDVHLP